MNDEDLMSYDEIIKKCEKCKSFRKWENLNMCISVDECRCNNFKYYTEVREPKNTRDCSNVLSNKCICRTRSENETSVDVCNRCNNFCKKEGK